VVPLLP
jgi:hypothetical protein